MLSVIITFSGLGAYGLLNDGRRISSTGSVVGVGVNVRLFWDPECTQEIDNINWGYLTPGDTIKKTIFIKNISSSSKTISINIEEWNPANLYQYFSFQLSCENEVLEPGDVLMGDIILTISQNIQNIYDFSFIIVIEGN